jgi:hypothetical protein
MLGRRRLGKTTLACSMAQQCAYRLIIDPRNQIHTGALRVFTMDELRDAMQSMMNAEIHEVIFTPRTDLDQSLAYAAECVTTWFETMPEDRRLMFLIDEGRFFPNSIKYARNEPVNYVLRAAPEWIDIAITAHRPADIATDTRGIVDYWYLFMHRQEHDLKVIEQRTSARVREMVERLEPRTFIEWDDGEADPLKAATLHRNPSAWYVPIKATAATEITERVRGGEPITVERKLF